MVGVGRAVGASVSKKQHKFGAEFDAAVYQWRTTKPRDWNYKTAGEMYAILARSLLYTELSRICKDDVSTGYPRDFVEQARAELWRRGDGPYKRDKNGA